MSLSTAELENQEKLKQELQNAQKASKLEDLAAALIGRLLDVPIGDGFAWNAKSTATLDQ